MIHQNKFPFTELQGQLPRSEKHLGIPILNQTHSIQIYNLILLKWTFIFKLLWGSNQYNDSDICWKICCSNLGRGKRTLSSPEHTDQLQRPPSLQIQLFLCQQGGQGRESEQSYPSRAMFKNQWSYTSTHHVSLHGAEWYTFTLP